MGVWNFCGTDDEKGTKMSSNSEKEKMESYFYKIKSKRPEITALAWMADSHYNNIIIKIISYLYSIFYHFP